MKSQSNANSNRPIGQTQFNANDVQMMWESCRHFYALAPNVSTSESSSSSMDDLPPLLEDALSHQNTSHNDSQRPSDMPNVCFWHPLLLLSYCCIVLSDSDRLPFSFSDCAVQSSQTSHVLTECESCSFGWTGWLVIWSAIQM
jgi:hypothetical protein